jgi:hypothetical protein
MSSLLPFLLTFVSLIILDLPDPDKMNTILPDDMLRSPNVGSMLSVLKMAARGDRVTLLVYVFVSTYKTGSHLFPLLHTPLRSR